MTGYFREGKHMKAHFNDYDQQIGVDFEAEIRYLWKNFYSPPHWHNGISFDEKTCVKSLRLGEF